MALLIDTWRAATSVNALAISSDGTHVGAGVGFNVVMWDRHTGNITLGPLQGHTSAINCTAFSPDGRTLVSASFDSTIRIWDTKTGDTVLGPLTGHTNYASSVTFSRDGHLLISGSWDTTIRFWNALTGQPAREPIRTGSHVFSVASSANGEKIFGALGDGTIRAYDTGSGAPLLTFEGHENSVYSVALSPDGHRIISGSSDKTIRIWDEATGNAIGSPLKGHTGLVWSVAFSSDGRYIVSGSHDNTIAIWNAETGTAVNDPLRQHTKNLRAIAFTPEGTHFLSGSEDKTIKVWDVRSLGVRSPNYGILEAQQNQLAPVEGEITGMTTLDEIVARLGLRGCPNLTNHLDTTSDTDYPISSGGFGDIYRSKLVNGTEVAIKTMRLYVGSSDQHQKHLKHAAHELYAWAQCRHPNVQRLLGVVMFRNQIGMVAKWETNGSLPNYLERHTDTDRCIISTQIAQGLSYLHQCKVIHGDLKGANVLMSEHGVPQLADFGNAVLGEYTLKFTATSTKDALSPRWAAPELFEGAPCSVSADMYALGMTILETITGDVPWQGKSDRAVMFALMIEKTHPERPEGHIPTDSEHGDTLWLLLKQCWDLTPEKRPSAADVMITMGKITQAGLKKGSATHKAHPSFWNLVFG